MKKMVVFTMFVVLASFMMNAAPEPDNNAVAGNWKYEVPRAPYGYQEGTVSLAEADDEWKGEVQFSDGYKINLKEISYKNDTLRFGLYVDYEYIRVEATVKENKMKGTVDTPEGAMNLTAKKIPEKK